MPDMHQIPDDTPPHRHLTPLTLFAAALGGFIVGALTATAQIVGRLP